MAVCWQLYRFDYSVFVQLRPALRTAATPAAFAALADSEETEAIVEAMLEDEIDVAEARQAFLLATCCGGEAISFHNSFPRLITSLRRERKAEAGLELLSEALAGGKNMESWLQPPIALIGFLTPRETLTLYEAYNLLTGSARQPGQGRRRIRRGGLLKAILAFFSRLFDREPPPEEVFRLLGDMLEEAIQRDEGIAVVAA